MLGNCVGSTILQYVSLWSRVHCADRPSTVGMAAEDEEYESPTDEVGIVDSALPCDCSAPERVLKRKCRWPFMGHKWSLMPEDVL